MKDIQDLYADVSACLLAMSNALESSGAASKAQIAEAFQERLLALPDATERPYLLLRQMATELSRSHPK